jgi:uncharacterized protein YqjF (DUF2071 family)
MIDRVLPTRRPNNRPVMKQSWRDLLFLHWPIPVQAIRPLIPADLELDLFDGSAYVGLVPFTMKGVRPVGFPPVRGLSSFHETNVRTYVHHQGTNPGVWFFSLDAANLIAVQLARTFFHLPYYHARMFLECEPSRESNRAAPILYAGVRRQPTPTPTSYALRARPTGSIEPARAETLEFFLAERYILYTRKRDTLLSGRVHHTPYPLQSAELLSLDESLLAAAGLERPPHRPLAHFAHGVDVDVFRLERATPAST